MKGYKGFNADLKCRDFQYEVGKTYETDKAELCESGFHFCECPLEVFSYYPPVLNGKMNRYCEVDADAVSDEKSEDSNRVSKNLTVGAEIGIPGLVKAHVEYVKENAKESIKKGEAEAATAGACGAATSRGVSAVGKEGVAVARGNGCKVKGGVGSVLVIAEEESSSYALASWKVEVVDGNRIKADTWYMLKDGEFVEVEE